jgi:PAS domain S-box-containing protein
MNFETMSKEQLVERLRTLESAEQALAEKQSAVAEKERLLHELQVHQVELEMQNRSLREMQGSLEESRSRYAELYDFAPIAYYTFDENGCILEVNLTGATMVGKDRGQLIGMPFAPLVRMEDPAQFWAHLRRCAQSRAPVIGELAFAATRAGRIQVQAVSTPVLDARGQPVAFRTAFTDISDRKRAEAEEKKAREAEQQLRAKLEAVDRAALVVNEVLASPDGGNMQLVLHTIIRQAVILSGAEFGAVGLGDQITTASSLPGIEGVIAAVTMDGLPVRIKDVRAHPVFNGFPASHPRITNVVAVPIRFGDMTVGLLFLANKQGGDEFSPQDERSMEMFAERVSYALEIARLNEGKARERERLELLADTGRALPSSLDLSVTLELVARLAIPRLADYCVIYLCESDQIRFGGVAHCDPAQERLLSRYHQGFRPDSNHPRSVVGEIVRTKQAVLVTRPSAEVADRARDCGELGGAISETAVESWIGVPVISRGRLLGVMLFAYSGSGRRYDSMDLAMAEEIAFRAALAVDNARLYQEAQVALRSRDNLMAIVSHDLRNPLNAIFLNLGLLSRPGASGERRRGRRQVDLIKRSAERLNRLVEDLLTASTIDAGRFTANPQPESVGVLFDDVLQTLEPLAAEQSLTLEASHRPETPRVLCDRDRLLQVFGNLVGNAVKVTPRGGTIAVKAERDGDFVCFCVSDTGPGIPPHHLPHLFDRYWKYEGSGSHGVGLGLYIVKGIIETHGGKVWVESTVGNGASFFFTLPVAY